MKNEYKGKPLSLDDTFATMAVKVYAEQLRFGEEGLVSAINNVSPYEMMVLAIKHHKSKKPHWHILVKFPNRETKKRVRTIIQLLNIEFRDGIDDKLLKHSIETTGYFNNYAAYLLHQTIDAKRDGKAPYDKTEIISNLTSDEVDRIIAGYTVSKKRLTGAQLDSAMDKARELGYQLGDIDEFIVSLSIAGLSASKEASLRRAYYNGAKERMNKREKWTRLNIIIKHNLAHPIDTQAICYASEKALEGKRLSASVDNKNISIQPSTEALIIHDYKDVALYNGTITEIGRPLFSEKSIWAGKYLINIGVGLSEEHFPNNIFWCKVENNKLISYKQPSDYSSEEEVTWLSDEYKKFRDKFNSALQDYYKLKKKSQKIFATIND